MRDDGIPVTDGHEEVIDPLGAEHGRVADGAIRSYRDLRVWQEAMDLVGAVYTAAARFPSDERFGRTAQLRRSAVSVPSNAAEGRGRTGESLLFVRYARGLLKEAETQWLLAGRLGCLDPDTVAALDARAQRLGRRLLALMRSLRASGGGPGASR